jgi:anti-anti-sigma factor
VQTVSARWRACLGVIFLIPRIGWSAGGIGQRDEGPDERLAVSVIWSRREGLVFLTGDADIATLHNLRSSLASVAAEHPTRVTLDLGGLCFIDCGSGRAVAEFRQTLIARGCLVSICGVAPVVQIVLDLYRITP